MAGNPSDRSVAAELRSQWSNPGDILSLLLIVGGDVVQKAIAQLTGVVSPVVLPGGRALCFTPVAFSFGWVAYAFAALMTAVGSKRLMPEFPDCPSLLINCSNAFVRENMSWVLGRVLRDHELRFEVDPRVTSLRVDIFQLKSAGAESSRAHLDRVWWSGVCTIVVQVLGFGVAGWVKWNDWGTMLITLGGTVLALLTASMPQWHEEKWSGRRLRRPKTVALTRGNGSHHVMVFRGEEGGWDLEALASGAPKIRRETQFLVFALAVLWTCLLISISGLTTHTWLVVGVGALGMVQNVYAAGAPRSAASQRIHMEPVGNGVIVAKGHDGMDEQVGDEDSAEGDIEQVDERLQKKTNDTVQGGVMEVLIELENRQPKAGLTLLEVFFPGGLSYNSDIFRENAAGNRDKRAFKALYRRIGRPIESPNWIGFERQSQQLRNIACTSGLVRNVALPVQSGPGGARSRSSSGSSADGAAVAVSG